MLDLIRHATDDDVSIIETDLKRVEPRLPPQPKLGLALRGSRLPSA